MGYLTIESLLVYLAAEQCRHTNTFCNNLSCSIRILNNFKLFHFSFFLFLITYLTMSMMYFWQARVDPGECRAGKQPRLLCPWYVILSKTCQYDCIYFLTNLKSMFSLMSSLSKKKGRVTIVLENPRKSWNWEKKFPGP